MCLGKGINHRLRVWCPFSFVKVQKCTITALVQNSQQPAKTITVGGWANRASKRVFFYLFAFHLMRKRTPGFFQNCSVHQWQSRRRSRLFVLTFHAADPNRGHWMGQTSQMRPLFLSETIGTYNKQGGWSKISTTIEVIEPLFGTRPFFWRVTLSLCNWGGDSLRLLMGKQKAA